MEVSSQGEFVSTTPPVELQAAELHGSASFMQHAQHLKVVIACAITRSQGE